VELARNQRRAPKVGPDPTVRFADPELSWLDFTERILAAAEELERPLSERARMAVHSSRSLDEAFLVRIGAQGAQNSDLLADPKVERKLNDFHQKVRALVRRQDRLFSEVLMPEISAKGIQLLRWSAINGRLQAGLTKHFERQILPALTPVIVDIAHPFSRCTSLSVNLAVVLDDPESGTDRIGCVPVPKLERFIQLSGSWCYIALEELIGAHLDSLFPGARVVSKHAFRITYDAHVDASKVKGSDLHDAPKLIARERERSRRATRLEVASSMPLNLCQFLTGGLGLSARDVYVCCNPLASSDFLSFIAIRYRGLKPVAWIGVTQPRLRALGPERGMFETLDEGDVLVHHPYDSFETSTQAFIEEAASDPLVVSIKQTLYRTAHLESPLVRALIEAAEAGKEVVVVVELLARFDEESNARLSRRLRHGGVHVVHGVDELKTHAKIALVVRAEEGGPGVRRYAHIATGNYHPGTATTFEDVGIFTADRGITADVAALFNSLTTSGRPIRLNRLLVSPTSLRAGLLELIQDEARRPNGKIAIKVNHLTDEEIIDALYAASSSGTSIDLVIRSTCALRPGVPGLSEKIRVRSIIGEYLEHSRIFRFGSGGRARYFIGSPDLMERNMQRRVECLTPVLDPNLTVRLDEILELELADDTLSWELNSRGCWDKVPKTRGINAQAEFRSRSLEMTAL
jgi:polyphosphate kinase